ncbi:MAG: hypothetical protein QXM17_08770 [Metallosphaera sp.]
MKSYIPRMRYQEPNYTQNPYPFGVMNNIGRGGIGNRLVIDDRLNNIINTLTVSLRGSGVPGAIMNMLVGFGENNRKLLYGDSYYLKKGQFDYVAPVSKGSQ